MLLGDYSRAICQRAIATQAGWDVDTGTEKIQVKAMRHGGSYARTSLSAIRSQNYDAVMVVVFNQDFTLESAWYIPRAVIEENVPFNAHVNGRIVRLTKTFKMLPGVRRVELSDSLLDQTAASVPAKLESVAEAGISTTTAQRL